MNYLKEIRAFYKISFSYMSPHSKLWVVLHSVKPLYGYLGAMKQDEDDEKYRLWCRTGIKLN